MKHATYAMQYLSVFPNDGHNCACSIGSSKSNGMDNEVAFYCLIICRILNIVKKKIRG